MTQAQNLHQSMTETAAYDGQPAQLVTLSNVHGMEVTFMDIGATWLSCILPVKGNRREVLLGVNSMDNFEKQASYMGTTVGRYANRIANGRFKIDGQNYKLETNQAGNTLHGGPNGFDKRRWNITEKTETSVVFTLESADGDQGFPGNLNVSVRYDITEDNRVSINYSEYTGNSQTGSKQNPPAWPYRWTLIWGSEVTRVFVRVSDSGLSGRLFGMFTSGAFPSSSKGL